MSETRDSYIFYRSFYEAMESLNDADQLAIYKSISIYALEGKDPEISGFPKTIFRLIKPILEANRIRWENGSKGGRPKNQNRTEKKPNDNQNVTEIKATETKPKANKDKDKELDKDKEENKDDKLFVPPTLEDIQAYIKEKDLNVNAGIFFENYNGANWHDKKGEQVKNWKLKAQTWSKKADNNGEHNRVEASNSVDLGAGEFIVDGKRCYGDRSHPVQIPENMPPRPSLQYCLDRENHKWIIQ